MQNFIFSDFNTIVDVKLQQWAEKILPRQCVDIGQSVLLDEFETLIEREQKSQSYDPITNDLKTQVVQECRTRHQWDSKALDSLVEYSSIKSFSKYIFSSSELFKHKSYKIVMFPINNNGN